MSELYVIRRKAADHAQPGEVTRMLVQADDPKDALRVAKAHHKGEYVKRDATGGKIRRGGFGRFFPQNVTVDPLNLAPGSRVIMVLRTGERVEEQL